MRPLAFLTGRWETLVRWSIETHRLVGGPIEVRGKARFSWREGGRFLRYEMGPSTWIIGRDESSGECSDLFGDERKAARVYRMTYGRSLWRMWRGAQGFHRRFEGKVGDHGRRIRGRWERFSDGRHWVYDFDLTFTKLGGPSRDGSPKLRDRGVSPSLLATPLDGTFGTSAQTRYAAD